MFYFALIFSGNRCVSFHFTVEKNRLVKKRKWGWWGRLRLLKRVLSLRFT